MTGITRNPDTNKPELTLADSSGDWLHVWEGNTGALIIVVGDEGGRQKFVFLNKTKAATLRDFLATIADGGVEVTTVRDVLAASAKSEVTS